MRRSSDNPVELPIHTWTAAMEQTKPAGESDWPRALLERHQGITVAFPQAAGTDLDTKADYDSLRTVWSSKDDRHE